MSAGAKSLVAVGSAISILVIVILGLAAFRAHSDVLAAAEPAPRTPDGLAHPPLVPRVTVIVDGVPPVQQATGIALDPSATVVWVTEEVVADGRLVRVDLASGAVTPVASGLNQPGHLVVSGTQALVAGNIGDPITLVQIDLDTGSVTPVSEELGGGLSGVAANRAWTRAYVVNFGSGVLSRADIDPTSATFRQVTPIAGGLSGPRDVVLNGAGDVAYVTEQNGGRLVRVDVNPASPDYGDVVTITAGLGGPRGLTLSQDEKRVYLAEEASRELTVIDVDPASAEYGTAVTILTGQALRDAVLSPDEHSAIVTDAGDGVLVVDVDPGSPNYGHIVTRLTPAPLDGARGLWMNGSRTRAYVVSEFSGYLSRVDVDPASPTFGQVARLASGLDVPVDVLVDANEQAAYVARERSPTRGTNVVSRVDLGSGQVTTVTEAVGQPVDLTFAPGGQAAYVVDLAYDQVHRLTVSSGVVTTVLKGLTNPFGLALAPDGVTAFVVTEPAAPTFPPGDLIAANLATGAWAILAHDVISGATSIVLNPAGTRAYVTQFGIETSCTGKLSHVDVDPLSPTYLGVTDILTGLCGPHDLHVRADERQFYVVLVGSRQLIRVDLVSMVYLPVVLRGS